MELLFREVFFQYRKQMSFSFLLNEYNHDHQPPLLLLLHTLPNNPITSLFPSSLALPSSRSNTLPCSSLLSVRKTFNRPHCSIYIHVIWYSNKREEFVGNLASPKDQHCKNGAQGDRSPLDGGGPSWRDTRTQDLHHRDQTETREGVSCFFRS